MRQVLVWLRSIIVLIALIVAVGGITRITGSGLSITEWKPIMGAIPPLSDLQWEEAFDKYKQIPQYKEINSSMSLSEFKWIFFWEYFHRLIGRIIGLAFAIPLLIFLVRKQIARKWIPHLIGLFALGGVQGFIGWFMVRSGLSELTYVSHYRLSVHLLFAFMIASYTLYLIKKMESENLPESDNAALHRQKDLTPQILISLRSTLFVLVVVQTLYGAFTAGLKSGYMSPTFPKMGPEWIPSSFWNLEPPLRNLVDNPISVQWIHRVIATLLVVILIPLWVMYRKKMTNPRERRALTVFAHLVALQYLLGIGVVLFGVPVWLGTLHQVVGFSIFLAAVNYWLELKPTSGRLNEAANTPA